MAAYTKLEAAELARLAAEYGLSCHSVTHLSSGYANTSYLLNCVDGRRVLTILDNHDKESARLLAGLLRHLDHYGMIVGELVTTVSGSDLANLDNKLIMVRRYVDGECYDLLPTEWLRPAGAALGRIHAIPAPNWLSHNGRRLPANALDRIRSFADRSFAQWLIRRLDEVEPITQFVGPTGLVHGDYFADNLVVTHDGRISVLDWETATRDLLVLDLGMAIVGLCRLQGEFVPERTALLLTGYMESRILEATEWAVLRRATVYAALIIAYHRYLRHHITHPDPSKQHLYREIPDFVNCLDLDWDRAVSHYWSPYR